MSDKKALHKFGKNKNAALLSFFFSFLNTSTRELLHLTKDEKIQQTDEHQTDRESIGYI